MRILHILNNLAVGNGAAKLVASLIPEQVRQGYTVDVLALKERELTYSKDIIKSGASYIVLNTDVNPKYDISLIFRLIPHIKKYDIVHVHLFPSLYWTLFAKLFSGAKCKLVTTEHSTENNRQGKKWIKPIERFVYNKYDHIIAISDAVKDYLVHFVDPIAPISIIYNGIKITDYKFAKPVSRRDLGIPENSILLLQVARLDSVKNQQLIIQALTHLPQSICVMFAGRGSLYDAYKQMAERLGVAERCFFLGVREDIPSIIKTADIILLPSKFEGFGLAAVEGMAAGKPVIASNVPGLQEVVKGAGVLISADNPLELANQILLISSDNDYKESLISRCEKRAQKYDINIMAAEYNNIYKNIIKDV